jgi:TRAP-type C4-dicarboxylate transport system substrate-binding protein
VHRHFFSSFARRAACCAIAALACVAALAQDKVDKPVELKLSVAQSAAFPLGKAAERWAQLVNENVAGGFDVRSYPGAVLAGRDPLREFGALRDGAADLAVGSALAWSAQLPQFGVYSLPWLAPEPREQEALATDAAVRDGVAARAALAGVVVLAIVPLGDRVLATVKSAVRTPADVSGLRLRVVANQLVIETLATLGASPQSMSFADAQAGLAGGTLDGQEAPASTLAATRIAASGQKFVTRWGAFNDVLVFAVRRALWDGWTDAQRSLVRTAAVDAARDARAQAREEAALAELTKQGVTLVRLTTAQHEALRAAVLPVWTKWSGMIGAGIVQAAEAAVAGAAATVAPAPAK